MTPLPDPERWHRIAPILEEALGMSLEQRAAFLDRVCAGDSDLRAEVESLLSADQKAGSFLGAPVDLSAVALARDDAADSDSGHLAAGRTGRAASVAGRTIGPYRIVREIGRGGMGVVYEAEQQRPRRPVALKVILGGRYVDADAVRLFQRESQSLARLKHPSIAAIYESGSTPEGEHFFAMELVQGRPLSDVLEEGGVPASRQGVRARLAVFRNICAAVAYAHQRGVIHRDLKPSNIIVLASPTESASGGASGRRAADEAPGVKVLDFGLARITDPDAEAATAVTALGRIQGTLPYMSPEQLRGRRDEVDVRTDVYSLGVILYRMLTGRLPYDLERAQFPEAARIVCDTPPRPIRTASGDRGPIDQDLAVIAFKALEKDPARRYQGVAALDEDIARYLAGQPILARPPSAAYLMRKLVARHKAPFAAAGGALVLLAAFAIVATLQARRIAAERDRANREAKTALRVSDFLTDLFKVSDPSEARGNSITAREILDRGAETTVKDLADEPEVQARLMLTMAKVYYSLGLYAQAMPILETSVATRRRLFGEENLDTLAAMDQLALHDTRVGRIPEAEKLYAQILETRRRLQGEDHVDTLKTMAGLAFVYMYQGSYDRAEALNRHLVETRRRLLGDDHEDTLASTIALANVYRARRQFADAELLYRKALEAYRRTLGDEHPGTNQTAASLASVYRRQGRYAEAETLLRQVLDTDRRVLGEDHPHTLEATNQLAVLFYEQGHYAEAEPLYRHTLERRRQVLGEDHYDTIVSMNTLANVYAAQKRYAEAETLMLEALRKTRRVLGENHPLAASTLYNLGCMTARRGRRQGALEWLGLAVAHGYSAPDEMAQDSDLAPLRGEPAFEALIEKARKNAEKSLGRSPATAGTSPGARASRAGSDR